MDTKERENEKNKSNRRLTQTHADRYSRAAFLILLPLSAYISIHLRFGSSAYFIRVPSCPFAVGFLGFAAGPPIFVVWGSFSVSGLNLSTLISEK
jgi:hypothetical protein